MPHKRSVRKEINRIEHKQARAAERQALEGGHHRVVQGMGWGTRIPQPPLLDEHRKLPGKKKGCKRNKGGAHTVEHWPSAPTWEYVWDDERNCYVQQAISWSRRSYHPPYRCSKCGKGFYRVPKNSEPRAARPQGTYTVNWENEVREDHWDLYNIRTRLLDLPCRCRTCNPS